MLPGREQPGPVFVPALTVATGTASSKPHLETQEPATGTSTALLSTSSTPGQQEGSWGHTYIKEKQIKSRQIATFGKKKLLTFISFKVLNQTKQQPCSDKPAVTFGVTAGEEWG